MNKDKIAFFDLDGTLIHNPKDMTKYVSNGKFNWSSFVNDMSNNDVVAKSAALLKELSNKGYYIIICTARPESLDDNLMAELTKRNFGEDMVIMRNMELFNAELKEIEQVDTSLPNFFELQREIAHRHHGIYRESIIQNFYDLYGKDNIEISYAVDDQQKNLDTFIKHGAKGVLVDERGNLFY